MRVLRDHRVLRMKVTDADRPAEPMKRLEPYQGELRRYAARMLGSRFEAEDAVQETMVRAWNALDRFEGRSQLRSWLYRICTNVCLDMLASRQRRALLELEVSQSEIATSAPGGAITTGVPSDADPADVAVARESVHLALVTVLHYLPPKQRAVLILREVLHWSATEIAELLGTSVASVNSALQRARATLRGLPVATRPIDVDETTRSRVGRYAQALESSDVIALTALLAHDAA
jgi:RNA polymerase sigma-70 factor (ECF subfamily)